ncbi:MAG: hypothetical protein KF682_22220 [Nitrospira sp.]|nr:hypothetical protein [Nitrospira sp.]
MNNSDTPSDIFDDAIQGDATGLRPLPGWRCQTPHILRVALPEQVRKAPSGRCDLPQGKLDLGLGAAVVVHELDQIGVGG